MLRGFVGRWGEGGGALVALSPSEAALWLRVCRGQEAPAQGPSTPTLQAHL